MQRRCSRLIIRGASACRFPGLAPACRARAPVRPRLLLLHTPLAGDCCAAEVNRLEESWMGKGRPFQAWPGTPETRAFLACCLGRRDRAV